MPNASFPRAWRLAAHQAHHRRGELRLLRAARRRRRAGARPVHRSSIVAEAFMFGAVRVRLPLHGRVRVTATCP